MGNLRRTFVSGKIEKDTDERLLEDGQYRHAENILILESEGSDLGAIQNSLSNRLLTNLNLGSNPVTLGTSSDETNKKLYWAVVSDTGCFFIEYDVINAVAVKVLEDTRPVANRVLNWKENFLITAISKVVTSSVEKDLMIINDDNIEPLCFNIERAKTYGPNGFDKEDIFLIKKPPRFAPKVQPTFISGSSNDIEQRFLTFSYKYKFLDGEYSALSSYTNYVFYPGAFKLDYEVLDNLGMLNTYNAVRVTINTGDKRVTDIQCAVKSTNSNNLYVIETFNKEKEGWGHNETRSFVFSNNKIYTVFPEKEIYRAYDNVPRKAKAQTIIGNLLVMGNFLEGYDLVDINSQKIKPMYNLSIVSNSLDGSLVPVSFSNGNTQNDILVINLTGKELKTGSKINVFVNLRSTADTQTDYNENYPFVLYKDYNNAIELSQDEDFIFFVNDLMTNLFLSNYTVSGLDDYVLQSNTHFSISATTATSISIQSPKLVFYKVGPPADTKTIYWPYQPDTNVLYYEIGNVSSLKSNRSLEVGIIYMDAFNRSTTVQTQLNNTVFIDHNLAMSKNTLKIVLSSNPPAFADRYKFVIKQRPLRHQTIYATIFYIDGLFRWIKLENDNFDKVKVGDNLIVKSDTSGFVPTLTKLKVLEIKSQPKNFIEGNVDDEGNEIKEIEGNYMKLKIPYNISMDYISGGFLEFSWKTQSKAGNFDLIIGPFTQSDGTDLPIKQGSRIDILLENNKYGSNGDSKKFEKTFFASADYDNFKIWFDTEVSGTGDFSYPTNGVFRGHRAFPFVEDPAGDLFLRIHSEINGNGQHPSYLSGSVNITAANGLIILETEEKKSVDEEIYLETEQTFEIINGRHQGNLQNQNNVLPAIIDLDFYNCFCMGNGAESYMIKDAFNQEFLNVDLRPSVVAIEEYKAIRRSTDLIFGEPYIESSNINGLNVFNTATGNFKELDKQYGSIQKLHSRDNDVLILKERKASKVMFEKDILYNVDGSSNVGSIDKTLGSEITYLGSNGIGKHPESFAENNYQIYYANPEQGEITRLSIDGTTAITNGLRDWFRDLFINQPNARMLGGYDGYTKQYMFSAGEEPVKLLQLSCGNEIIKDNQQGSFTYEFKLNNLSGDVIINYNISSGNATIIAQFNGVDHVTSNATGLGNISFNRTSLIENIVTVTIISVSAAVSYSIANVCPMGSELKIVSVLLNDLDDVGKNTITRFKWGNSNLYSNDDEFINTPVSKFFTETGVEGVGKFPLNNSIVTVQAFKDMTTSGQFSLDECNRLGYLVSSTQYNANDISEILSLANFMNISSAIEDGYSDTKFSNFLFNRTPSQILYLIWDYTNRKPVAVNDLYSVDQGSSVICTVKSNDDTKGNNALNVIIITQPSQGTLTVNSDGTVTYSHNNGTVTEDYFTYMLNSGTCSSNIATVSITINIPLPTGLEIISSRIGGDGNGKFEILNGVPGETVDLSFQMYNFEENFGSLDFEPDLVGVLDPLHDHRSGFAVLDSSGYAYFEYRIEPSDTLASCEVTVTERSSGGPTGQTTTIV